MSIKQTDSLDIVNAIVENIVVTDYEALPPDVIDMTKKQILDALGCILAGTSGLRVKELMEMVGEWGGKEESTIVNYRRRVPSPNAAFVNAIVGSVCDFDDTADENPIHAEIPVVSAGFATAERKGAVQGKDFVTAVALGIDLAYRMVLANQLTLGSGYGWDFSVTYGFFSSAATSGKILGLDMDKVRNALALAYRQAGGGGQAGMTTKLGQSMEPLGIDSTKELGKGFAAKGGVISALLAEKGFTGMKDFLAGPGGIYDTYMRGDLIPEALTKDLGTIFRGVEGGFKPYSSCRCNHAGIDAALALVQENNIKPEDVERITAYACKMIFDSNCVPLEIKQNPPNPGAAMFSLPWTVALAVFFRRVDPRGFTVEALKNPDVLNLAHKVFAEYKPELDTGRGCQPAILEIETKGGQTYSKRIDHLFGSRENPMSTEDLIRKFRECATTYAANPLPTTKVDELLHMVLQLENQSDVSQVIRLLA